MLNDRPTPPPATPKVVLPTIAELFSENIEEAYKTEQLNLLLNQEPNPKWVKEHPYIFQEIEVNGNKTKVPYKYLPIDKVEFLLRKIFKKYSIEITGHSTAFNGTVVTVRVHYFDPISNEMRFHDGIGATQLQTKKGTSSADLSNINNGALSMAYPLSKTLAIKDACDHFGKLFGADLNRRDTIPFTEDKNLEGAAIDPVIQEQFDLITDVDGLIQYTSNLPDSTTKTFSFRKAFNKRKQELQPKLP